MSDERPARENTPAAPDRDRAPTPPETVQLTPEPPPSPAYRPLPLDEEWAIDLRGRYR
jgi:hypothetical protein